MVNNKIALVIREAPPRPLEKDYFHLDPNLVLKFGRVRDWMYSISFPRYPEAVRDYFAAYELMWEGQKRVEEVRREERMKKRLSRTEFRPDLVMEEKPPQTRHIPEYRRKHRLGKRRNHEGSQPGFKRKHTKIKNKRAKEYSYKQGFYVNSQIQ